MKILGAGLLVLALAGCTSGSTSSALPTSCKQTDRVGTYRLTYVEQSGDCGPIDSQLVSFNPGEPGGMGAGAGCTLNSERWSEGDCKLERDITCPVAGGGTVRFVGVTRAQTSNSSELAGPATLTIYTPKVSCTGTYALDAVRQ